MHKVSDFIKVVAILVDIVKYTSERYIEFKDTYCTKISLNSIRTPIRIVLKVSLYGKRNNSNRRHIKLL